MTFGLNKTFVHQIFISDGNSQVPDTVKSVDKYFLDSDYMHIVWDDKKIKDFIRQNFHPSVSMAYNSLRSYAFKADLARYCILYKLGGWYIDAMMEVVDVPPDIKLYDMFLVRDFYAAKYTAPWQIANGLIYSKPDHPVFKNMIDQIVINCRNKDYGTKALSVTGPELFGRVIANYGYTNNGTSYLIGNHIMDEATNTRFIVYENVKFVKAKMIKGGELNIPGTNSYVKLWESEKIFGEMKL
jgi:mannosyltransferase OCH1-like enzyme